MTRALPATGTCEQCRQPVIDATLATGDPIRLDAAPASDGAYGAFYSTRGYWRATPHRDGDAFNGLRRREHACADTQLELT